MVKKTPPWSYNFLFKLYPILAVKAEKESNVFYNMLYNTLHVFEHAFATSTWKFFVSLVLLPIITYKCNMEVITILSFTPSLSLWPFADLWMSVLARFLITVSPFQIDFAYFTWVWESTYCYIFAVTFVKVSTFNFLVFWLLVLSELYCIISCNTFWLLLYFEHFQFSLPMLLPWSLSL